LAAFGLASSTGDTGLPSSPAAIERAAIHGNAYGSPRKTYLYDLRDKDGNHLKYGITSAEPPENHYSNSFLRDKEMIIVDEGSRRQMAERERALTIGLPGPLNN